MSEIQVGVSKDEIDKMDQRYRVKFINSLSGAKSANLIGTVDSEGKENLSIVSSCVHLGADPALIGMVIRPRSVPRHTFENIEELGVWTINHIHQEIIRPAHQTSARYPKENSEFGEVGLTPEYLDGFKAPYVEEARLKIGVVLKQVIPLDINGTEFVIGEITNVYLPQLALLDDGGVDLAKLNTVSVVGLDWYHQLQPLARLSYAKPGRPLEEI